MADRVCGSRPRTWARRAADRSRRSGTAALVHGGPDSTGRVRLNGESQRDAKRKSCAQPCSPWARRRWGLAPERQELPGSPAIRLRSHPCRSTDCSTGRTRSGRCNHCSHSSGDAAGHGSRAGHSKSSRRHRSRSSYKSSRRDRLARRPRCCRTSTQYRPLPRTEPKPAKTDDSSQHLSERRDWLVHHSRPPWPTRPWTPVDCALLLHFLGRCAATNPRDQHYARQRSGRFGKPLQ